MESDTGVRGSGGKEKIVESIKESLMELYGKKEYSNNVLYVVEIVDCLRKSYYNRKYNNYGAYNYNTAVGITMHKYLLPKLKDKMGGMFEYPIKYDTDNYSIHGVVDYINTDEEYIIELKVSKYGKMLDRYIYQTKAYLYLTGIDIGYIIMLTADGIIIKEVTTNNKFNETFIKRADALYNALVNDTPPIATSINPDYNMCKYCPYVKHCMRTL